MPFKEYVQAKIPETNNVAYNTQAEVYDAMFRMLEQAVDSIKPNDATQIGYATDDICYHGDWNKWLRFANSLRLRMALRISNVDPARAKEEAHELLNGVKLSENAIAL
jgi:lactam utilization protein B